MRIFQTIAQRIRSGRAFRKLTAARRMAAEWELNSAELNRAMQLHRKELEIIASRLSALAAAVNEDLKTSEELQRQQEVVVESLRNENRVYSEVLVPSLTAANSVMLQRYDTELSLLVKRQVIATKQEE